MCLNPALSSVSLSLSPLAIHDQSTLGGIAILPFALDIQSPLLCISQPTNNIIPDIPPSRHRSITTQTTAHTSTFTTASFLPPLIRLASLQFDGNSAWLPLIAFSQPFSLAKHIIRLS